MPKQESDEQTRRAFFGRATALAAAAPAARPARAATTIYAYVGCYTTAARQARGDGIHVYRMDAETGAWNHVQHLGDLVNPSFLILGRGQRFLYSVHGDETYASSFTVDKNTGFLTPLNRAGTGGRNGVHQAIDPSGRYMLVANYASGTVSVLPVKPDGALGDHIQLVELRGPTGPHCVQQASSHPHHVVFDPSGRFVFVPDKGLDRVFAFRFDPASGRLSPTQHGPGIARAGSGPRHVACHPTLPIVWALNEIGSSTTTYHWNAEQGVLRPLQILPSLPPDFTGESTAAEIAVSSGGRFVYCSNRGHDSVAMYAADPRTGLLTSIGWVATQGKVPRFIALDPTQRFLYAANEHEDTIVTFRMDQATGRLTKTGPAIHNASPVTIAFGGGA